MLVLTIGGGGSPAARTETLAFLPAHGCWWLGCSARSLQLLGLEEQSFVSCSLTCGQEGQGLRKPTDVAEFAFRAFFFSFPCIYLFVVVTLIALLKLQCRSGLSAASRALSGCSPHTDLALLLQTDSAHSSAGSTSRSLSLHLCSSMRPIPGAGSSSGWRRFWRHKANLRSPQALSWLGPCSHRLLLQPQCGLSDGNTGWRIVPFISLSSCFFFLEEKKKKYAPWRKQGSHLCLFVKCTFLYYPAISCWMWHCLGSSKEAAFIAERSILQTGNLHLALLL